MQHKSRFLGVRFLARFLGGVFSLLSFISIAPCIAPTVALAAPLADLKISSARVQLHKSETDSYKLVILPLAKPSPVGKGAASDPVKVSQAPKTATQPKRIVVDYYGLMGKGTKNVSLSDKRLKAIRIGDHSDRTRIVIDLRSDAPVNISSPVRLGTGDAFRVEFTLHHEVPPKKHASPTLSPTPGPSPSPKATPVATALPSPLPTPLVTALETPLPATPLPPKPNATKPIGTPPLATPEVFGTEEPGEIAEEFPTGVPTRLPASTPLATPVATPASEIPVANPEVHLATPEPSAPLLVPSPQNSGETVLTEFGFEKLKDSGASALYLVLVPVRSYTLEKRRDDLYELSIEGGKLGQAGLALPRFSPEGIEGFDTVVAKQVENSVVIRIFVDEGVRLFPFVADGKLWVKAIR